MEKEYQIDFNILDETMAAEHAVAYEVNRELNLAWQIVEDTGANLFLTGRAGTGKTTFLRKLRETSSKRMVVLAPTGVAAINARGGTIHSFFQLPFSPFIPGKGFVAQDRRYVPFSNQKKRILASMSLLVIDEVSMVRPDILDAIDSVLRRFRKSTLPFGGVQLLLIGDLRQLPPVVKNDEWEFLSDHYRTPYFFESKALQKAGYLTVELSTIYRQRDSNFISILNKVRDGKVDFETLSLLNSRYIPGFQPDERQGYIRLTTHNNMANNYNAGKLAALPGECFEYKAQVKGDFPDYNFPAESVLKLKVGAQVMFIKNDTSSDRRYYNGLIGTVVGLSEEKVQIQPLNGEGVIDAEPVEWENTKYTVNEQTKNIVTETIGTFTQYPLRLAWAITIHKSQGLTFDRAIIEARSSFAPGQTYVALSRCRSLEGLVLGAPVPPSAVITDSEITSFVDYCEKHKPSEESIHPLKSEYQRFLLSEMFDFIRLYTLFKDFLRRAEEYLYRYFPTASSTLNDVKQTADSEILEIGTKFINRYVAMAPDITALLQDPAFQGRIKDGCSYFFEKLNKVDRALKLLPRNIPNAVYAKRLEDSFQALWQEVNFRIKLMELMRDKDFNVKSYLEAKSVAAIDTGSPVTAGAGTRRKKKKTGRKTGKA